MFYISIFFFLDSSKKKTSRFPKSKQTTMRLITHRGFFHDNKAVGVLFSLIHPIVPDTLPWSETDLLWIGQEWVLCHDHGR
ncbi:hypothetical protein EBZ80_22010, partial [bacterium]|nr:hypothetical protein [bacterium]